jgi:hypothetical protein
MEMEIVHAIQDIMKEHMGCVHYVSLLAILAQMEQLALDVILELSKL